MGLKSLRLHAEAFAHGKYFAKDGGHDSPLERRMAFDLVKAVDCATGGGVAKIDADLQGRFVLGWVHARDGDPVAVRLREGGEAEWRFVDDPDIAGSNDDFADNPNVSEWFEGFNRGKPEHKIFEVLFKHYEAAFGSKLAVKPDVLAR